MNNVLSPYGPKLDKKCVFKTAQINMNIDPKTARLCYLYKHDTFEYMSIILPYGYVGDIVIHPVLDNTKIENINFADSITQEELSICMVYGLDMDYYNSVFCESGLDMSRDECLKLANLNRESGKTSKVRMRVV